MILYLRHHSFSHLFINQILLGHMQSTARRPVWAQTPENGNFKILMRELGEQRRKGWYWTVCVICRERLSD